MVVVGCVGFGWWLCEEEYIFGSGASFDCGRCSEVLY